MRKGERRVKSRDALSDAAAGEFAADDVGRGGGDCVDRISLRYELLASSFTHSQPSSRCQCRCRQKRPGLEEANGQSCLYVEQKPVSHSCTREPAQRLSVVFSDKARRDRTYRDRASLRNVDKELLDRLPAHRARKVPCCRNQSISMRPGSERTLDEPGEMTMAKSAPASAATLVNSIVSFVELAPVPAMRGT